MKDEDGGEITATTKHTSTIKRTRSYELRIASPNLAP